MGRGKSRQGGAGRRQNRRLVLVHSRSRRRVLPGPPATGGGASGEGSVAYLSWHDFLEADCRRDEGLLCFYDRPMTPRMAAFSRFLAAWLGVLDNDETMEGLVISR